jgi:hypothetical protein
VHYADVIAPTLPFAIAFAFLLVVNVFLGIKRRFSSTPAAAYQPTDVRLHLFFAAM